MKVKVEVEPDNIDLTMDWQAALPILLLVHKDAETKEGRDAALSQLQWMAYLADNIGKPLDIEIYEENDCFNVMIRFEDGDPLEEFENIPTYEEAYEKAEELMVKYEGRWTNFNEIGV